MKKLFLLLLVSIIFQCTTIAQQRSSMLGLTASYDYVENRSHYSDDKYTKSITVGLEYSETKGAFGFRAGFSYSKIKDYIPYFGDDLIFIPAVLPDEASIEVFDFPFTGQVYLGKKKLKLYANAGLITSLSKVKEYNSPYSSYDSNSPVKSLSLRGIYGAGITYQLSNHFGLDLGINQRVHLYTLDDHFLRPADSYGFQTKLNYIF